MATKTVKKTTAKKSKRVTRKNTVIKTVIRPNSKGVFPKKELDSIFGKIQVPIIYRDSTNRVMFNIFNDRNIEIGLPDEYNPKSTITVYHGFTDFRQIIINVDEPELDHKINLTHKDWLNNQEIKILEAIQKNDNKLIIEILCKEFECNFEDLSAGSLKLKSLVNKELDDILSSLESQIFDILGDKIPDWLAAKTIWEDSSLADICRDYKTKTTKQFVIETFANGYVTLIAPPSSTTLLIGYDHDSFMPFISQLKESVTTLAKAHYLLLPTELVCSGVDYQRQGEFFFVPSDSIKVDLNDITLSNNEDLNRLFGKISHRFHNATETLVTGDGTVYAKGYVYSNNHTTIDLLTWHKVLRNNEVEIRDGNYD